MANTDGPNRLFYGDNLDVLRKLPSESVDLVYLDPPFNSARNYNVIFARHGETPSGAGAQIQAFEDTWTWDHETASHFGDYVSGALPNRVAEALTAFHTLVGENDALAYLVNMAPRLVQLHRVLKSKGSLYLHCDPTMSHYLKILLDAVFDPRSFKSEVIWKRSSAHSSAKRFGPIHDVILFYTKSEKYVWNKIFEPIPQETIDQWYNNVDPDGRRFNRADLTAPGVRVGESGADWRDISVTGKGRHCEPLRIMGPPVERAGVPAGPAHLGARSTRREATQPAAGVPPLHRSAAGTVAVWVLHALRPVNVGDHVVT